MTAGMQINDGERPRPPRAVTTTTDREGRFNRRVRRAGIGGRALRGGLAERLDGTGAVCAAPIEEGRRAPRTLVREGLHRRALIVADALVAAFIVAAAVVVEQRPGGLGHPHRRAGDGRRQQGGGALRARRARAAEVDARGDARAGAGQRALRAARVAAAPGSVGLSGVLLLAVATFALLFTGRVAARWIARRLATVERCMVIGDEASIATVSAKLASSPAKAAVVTSMRTASG